MENGKSHKVYLGSCRTMTGEQALKGKGEKSEGFRPGKRLDDYPTPQGIFSRALTAAMSSCNCLMVGFSWSSLSPLISERIWVLVLAISS